VRRLNVDVGDRLFVLRSSPNAAAMLLPAPAVVGGDGVLDEVRHQPRQELGVQASMSSSRSRMVS